MRKPVVGVIGNAHRVENRFQVQMVGERNLRAVAEVSGGLPMMFAGAPDITDIGALLDVVDGIVLTGARAPASIRPVSMSIRASARALRHPPRRGGRWRSRSPASPAAFRCSASAGACRR